MSVDDLAVGQPFQLGVNYWPRRKAMYWWRHFERDEVAEEFDVIAGLGLRLVRLDSFSALAVLLGEAVTVHFYTFVGVPVSTSQAVIGAVMGIGLLKGVRTVSRRMLLFILSGWLLTPFVAAALVLALTRLWGGS